jgi:ABC-type nitrate/sulfonate/bicarbonate transport system permease component
MASIDIRSDPVEFKPAPRLGSTAWAARAATWAGRINIEGTVALLLLVIGWQLASLYWPPILFPSLSRIGAALRDIVTNPAAISAIGLTYLRIIVALSIGFAAATTVGIVAGLVRPIERAVLPPFEVMQGVPAVCWIIFAVLWFRDMETRIAFVVIVTTMPSFFYLARDSVRSISVELWDMVRSWRPSARQLLRILILPALLPALLTGWRVNLGSGTRVTIMAELLGGVSGIGYQLRLSEEFFRMDRAIAWTVVLVAFVVATNAALSLFERKMLRWRHDRRAHD